MKIGIMFATAAVAATMACNSNTSKQENTASDSAANAAPAPDPAAAASAFVTGVVQEISMGKDGYTAVIKSAQDSIYHVTISHANLKDHTQYKSAKPGDTLAVSGDRWEMDGKARMTVRELR